MDCKSLKALTLPAGVTSLGSSAFCLSGIEEIVLPAGITELSPSLFSNCKSLKKLTISSPITSCGNSALFGCDNLTCIVYQNTTYPSVDAFLAVVEK